MEKRTPLLDLICLALFILGSGLAMALGDPLTAIWFLLLALLVKPAGE